MDPMQMLDMKTRTGVSSEDAEAFANKMDMISEAMEQIKAGTFDPNNCKIPGYKTPEEEARERLERMQKEEERLKREQARKEKEKKEERELWWGRAKLRYSVTEDDGENANVENQAATLTNDYASYRNRILAAYKARDANDYSSWDQWEPQDPATRAEKEEIETQAEKQRNREFEANNPDFCSQFREDMNKRQVSQKEKERKAEQSKLQGNRCFKKKEYGKAIESYMKGLKESNYHIAILTNIAQCHLRREAYEDCIEFATRALFIQPDHVKALSRRAAAWHRQGNLDKAAADMQRALAIAPVNADIIEQHSLIVGDYDDAKAYDELQLQLKGKEHKDIAAQIHFAREVWKRIDGEHQGDNATITSFGLYELLHPFLRNKEILTLFRTSGELTKMCDRIVTMSNTTNFDSEQQYVLGILLQTIAIVIQDNARNQLIAYRHDQLRLVMIQLLENVDGGGESQDASAMLAWHEYVLSFWESAIDSKSWRCHLVKSLKAMHTLSSILANTAIPSTSAVRNTLRKVTSIIFSLSGSDQRGQAFHNTETVWLASIVNVMKSLKPSSVILCNVLGVATNLSTTESGRQALLIPDQEALRIGMVQQLVRVIHNFQNLLAASQIDKSSAKFRQSVQNTERALAALLNFTHNDTNGIVRQALAESSIVTAATTVMIHTSQSNLHEFLVVVSRSLSLLCRLHAVTLLSGKVTDGNLNETNSLVATSLLDTLEHVTQQVLLFQECNPTQANDVWQLLSHLWCHIAWTSNAACAREYLREKNTVKLMFQLIYLIHSQKGYRSQGDDGARERVIGNIMKTLFAFVSDRDKKDTDVFSRATNVETLVNVLQFLPRGGARKNTAILLAKLCQNDEGIKDNVRRLRGIEIMHSVSQEIQDIDSTK